MSNFLGTLIQRERGDVAPAISPRLPSRHEPIERKSSVAVFEETEPAEASWEHSHTNARQYAHHKTPPAHSSRVENADIMQTPDQSVQVGHGKNPPPSYASIAPLEQKTANISPASPTIASPTREPAAEHGPITPHKDLAPADPAPELGAKEPAGAEERHVRVTSRISDATGYEEISEIAKTPGSGEFDRNSHGPIPLAPEHEIETVGSETIAPAHKFVARHPATVHREDSSPANSMPSTGGEPVHPATRQVVATPQINNVIKQEGRAERSNRPVSVPEQFDVSPTHTLVAAQVIVPATPSPAHRDAEHAATAIPEDSPPSDSRLIKGAIKRMQDVHKADKPDQHTPISQSEGNARRDEHGNGLLPLSRGIVPVQATVRKSSDLTPPISHATANTSPYREPDMPSVPVPVPTINVSIGRIEVRAVMPAATPRRPDAGPKAMSLDQYLNRSRGQRNQQERS